MKKTESTKDLLVTSAGELFAKKGFDGISTRMIADRAGVKLSAIHYHFGSKEKLYEEACLVGESRGRSTTFKDVIDENPNLMESPAGQAEIIRSIVFQNFKTRFRPDRPEWETKIMLRELAAPTKAMAKIVELFFKPDSESAAAFYKEVKPGSSDSEAAAWSDLMYGQVILYSTAGKAIGMLRGENFLNTDYFSIAAETLSRAMILEAGLPLPTDLQGKKLD